jgi:corrinoid protein of di/trimethylamine methyltransferase
MSILEDISSLLQEGRAKQVVALVRQALDEGMDPKSIMNDGLLAGMAVIGEQFKAGEVYVPEVLIAARAMNMGMAELKDALLAEGVEANGVAVVGTVKGDLHDIGKNLVKMMLEGKGINVIDLGVDVSAEKFVAEAKANGANLICCSALLTTTMGEMAEVVKKAEEEGIRDQVWIMVGGAPITQEYCDKIGADCYTSDAASAADAALEHLTK